MFDSWEGTSSKEKLNEILGRDKTEKLLKNIKASEEEIDLTDEDRNILKDLLRDSLTFD